MLKIIDVDYKFLLDIIITRNIDKYEKSKI